GNADEFSDRGQPSVATPARKRSNAWHPDALHPNPGPHAAPSNVGFKNNQMAYQNYWIGMSVDDFTQTPLPAGCTVEKREAPNAHVTLLRINRTTDSGNSLGGSPFDPEFVFLHSKQG